LQTPVLSLRRAPDLLVRAVGADHLSAELDAALSDPVLGLARNDLCIDVQQGETTVYSRNPTRMLLPASNLKLLTATAALDKLGPDDRLVTVVRAGRPAASGEVSGDLYLVGGGDPLLRTAGYVASLPYRELIYSHLETLARQVKAAGVTHVTGGVIGDESRYDQQRYVPTWRPSYQSTGEVGPLSALSVNDGFVAVQPTPVPSRQPAQDAAATCTALLKAQGVAVDGSPAAGRAPAGATTITSMPSPPMSDLLAEAVLRQSDNDGAELITKEIGRQVAGAPTTLAGVAAIRADLQADGLPVDQLSAVDGSGLDRSDRASCQLVMAALQRSGPDGLLARGLPVAGRTGTLQDRFIGTAAAGRLEAKTGTLDGVSALSGFVLPLTGPSAGARSGVTLTPAFSMIVNSLPSMATGEALEDRVGAILAQYPEAPPVTELLPLPAAAVSPG
jgi:D-alanyl-D-alanine carboxypeptidase/D-alanyl-D-alanine-endopeptidase (penicillin-binding protein 4)